MAKIIQSTRKPNPGPENEFFKLIQKEDTEDWFLNFDYMIPDHLSKIRGSDIDVLIIAPDIGLFTIEVKGKYQIDDSGNFHFNYSGDEWKRSQSPYDQIDGNWQAFLNHLKKNDKFQNIQPVKLVVFPICEFSHYSQNSPENQTVDLKDIAKNGVKKTLRAKALSRYEELKASDLKYPIQKEDIIIDQSKCNSLKSYLFPSGKGKVSMETLSNLFNKEIKSFTEDQYTVLDTTKNIKLSLVTGPASTGKTFLAIEKALRSARADLRTLILFPTIALRAHWTFKLNKLDEYKYIEIEVMHGLAVKILKEYNVDTSSFKRKTGGINYGQYILKATEIAMDNDLRYDTIIIDEAQELTRDQIDLIDALTGQGFESNSYDSVYMTGDFVHQALITNDTRAIGESSGNDKKDNGSLLHFLGTKGFINISLEINCRNNPSIIKEITKRYGSIWTKSLNSLTDKDPKVEYYWFDSSDDFYSQLRKTLDHWQSIGVDVKENCKIVCLDKSFKVDDWNKNSDKYDFVSMDGIDQTTASFTGGDINRMMMALIKDENEKKEYAAKHPAVNKIRIEVYSIWHFRGLESDFVIFILPSKLKVKKPESKQNRITLGMTRARIGIKIFGSKKMKNIYFN